MPTIQSVVREISREFVPQFEEKLRIYLADQEREWLIEQIVRLTLDAHSLEELDRKHYLDDENKKRTKRIERVKRLNLGEKKLNLLIARYKGITREKMIADKLLKSDAPPRGMELISENSRTAEGNTLLQTAKDMLYGLLFGETSLNVNFDRTQRELLTLSLPRAKSRVLDFRKSNTEISAIGNLLDMTDAGNDMHADHIQLEVEYGEAENELIGDGIITTLKIINHLEINEEVLYGRMINMEQSTLASQKLMKIQ